jgi:F0F1-type ATP synthase membrane subunit c/vacuolar-type H+-ATPase subunit K
LESINWFGLLGNALWIVGLAACLATVSMAHYQARVGADRLWAGLRQPESQSALAIGAVLFCVGLLLCSGTWWERGIWGLCAAVLIVWAVRLARCLGREGEKRA